MSEQSYAFEAGGEERLTLSWNPGRVGLTVLLDGEPIGVAPHQKALRQGYEISLPDGSTLKIKLVIRFPNKALQVSRNGQPLPGSDLDPSVRLGAASYAVYVFAVFTGVIGAIHLFFDLEFMRCVGAGTETIIFGLIFLVLGFLIQRKSAIALILSIIVAVFYGIETYSFSISQGCGPGISGYISVLFFLAMVLPGVKAIRDLKQKKE